MKLIMKILEIFRTTNNNKQIKMLKNAVIDQIFGIMQTNQPHSLEEHQQPAEFRYKNIITQITNQQRESINKLIQINSNSI